MKIKIQFYPDTFEFETKVNFPKFDNNNIELCQIRNRVLHKQMNKLKIKSPNHDYSDYVVENVTKFLEGEIWQLGS